MTEIPTVAPGIAPGVAVRGLGRGQIPIGDVLHGCGHHRRAEGREAVMALLADTARCPDYTSPAPAKEAA